MIIVITFAEGEDGEKKRISRTALGRVGLGPQRVAGAVNQEGAVLQNDDARDAGNKKRARRAGPVIP